MDKQLDKCSLYFSGALAPEFDTKKAIDCLFQNLKLKKDTIRSILVDKDKPIVTGVSKITANSLMNTFQLNGLITYIIEDDKIIDNILIKNDDPSISKIIKDIESNAKKDLTSNVESNVKKDLTSSIATKTNKFIAQQKKIKDITFNKFLDNKDDILFKLKRSLRTCIIDKPVDKRGRASRSEYWYFMLFYFLILVAYSWLYDILNLNTNNILNFLLSYCCISLISPMIFVHIRRLHDINFSGWWLITGVLPFGTLLILNSTIENKKPNTYGNFRPRSHKLNQIINISYYIFIFIVVLIYFASQEKLHFDINDTQEMHYSAPRSNNMSQQNRTARMHTPEEVRSSIDYHIDKRGPIIKGFQLGMSIDEAIQAANNLKLVILIDNKDHKSIIFGTKDQVKDSEKHHPLTTDMFGSTITIETDGKTVNYIKFSNLTYLFNAKGTREGFIQSFINKYDIDRVEPRKSTNMFGTSQFYYFANKREGWDIRFYPSSNAEVDYISLSGITKESGSFDF